MAHICPHTPTYSRLLRPFNMSNNRKHAFTSLQEVVFMLKKTMKRYHKIGWLNRWQVVTTLCVLLEFILCFFRDVKDKKDLCQMMFIFAKLKYLKYSHIF